MSQNKPEAQKRLESLLLEGLNDEEMTRVGNTAPA